jgi:hypothetical protein
MPSVKALRLSKLVMKKDLPKATLDRLRQNTTLAPTPSVKALGPWKPIKKKKFAEGVQKKYRLEQCASRYFVYSV